MTNPLNQRLSAQMITLQEQGLLRKRRTISSPTGRDLIIDGETFLSFASNDYLGLANHPEIQQAYIKGVELWGNGCGASHLLGGHLLPHQQLEDQLAEFSGFPAALAFSSGYLANLAVIPSLSAGRRTTIFADKLNHASLVDAVMLAKAKGAAVVRFPHGQLDLLANKLEQCTTPEKIIVTDSVFSMDGDLANLPEYLNLANKHQALLVIDDAHGFGVLGKNGRGSLDHFGLPAAANVVLMATFGKAAGVGGAFVAAAKLLIDYLLQSARTYIYTTASPPAISSALCCSLNIIAAAEDRRRQLSDNISYFRNLAQTHHLPLNNSSTAIQPIMLRENHAAVQLADRLWQQRIWAPAIRPPTVPVGSARLRISLTAHHTFSDIDRLITALLPAYQQDDH